MTKTKGRSVILSTSVMARLMEDLNARQSIQQDSLLKCYTNGYNGDQQMAELGLGMYTLSEASRLIGADTRAISRWLYGYDYSSGSGSKHIRKHSDPLWSPQYATNEFGEKIIGFHDLLELRIVREFIRRGVSLQVIRHCLYTARQIFDVEYPFTSRRFATDGETIFLAAVRQGGKEAEMLNLRTRQYAFREIIKDSLYAGIEYAGDFASRWYPMARSKVVVVNPAIDFGHPIVEESGIPTASLYATYLAEERNKSVVAQIFEISAKHVAAAVRFEEKLRIAA
jgi:uncharacterized protein (DUF433 family)